MQGRIAGFSRVYIFAVNMFCAKMKLVLDEFCGSEFYEFTFLLTFQKSFALPIQLPVLKIFFRWSVPFYNW